MSSGQESYQIYEVWSRLDIACLCQCKISNFLLPAGGALSVSEPRTFSGRLFQSLGARYEKVLPPFVDFAILGTTKSPEFCDLRERVGL